MLSEVCGDMIVCNNMVLLVHAAGGRKPCVAFVGSS